jgi:lysophospholipase L1-like esterase
MLIASIRAAGLAALAAGVLAAPASAAPRATYLALGDSITFGYEEPQVVPAPDYAHASTFLAYPEQLGAERRLKVVNVACPGETSASLVNASAPSNGCENAYRAHFPLHVRYKGSQLAYAVKFLRHHRRTRLVSLMVGANDLFLCQKSTNDGCGAPAEQAATFKAIAGNVRKVVESVRGKARYRGRVAIVDYYSLDYSSATIDGVTTALNAAVNKAARPFHVVTADGFGTWRAAAAHSGDSSCTAGLLTQLGSPGTCGEHPSYAGQALLAEALLKAVRI